MSNDSDKYINLLPDSFLKTRDSNNYKILSLNADLLSELKSDINAVNESLDIFLATGKTLDLYGKIYGQLRGQLNDTKYRYMILFRIATNTESRAPKKRQHHPQQLVERMGQGNHRHAESAPAGNRNRQRRKGGMETRFLEGSRLGTIHDHTALRPTRGP